MIVDISPIGRPNADNLSGPANATPGPIVEIGNTRTEVIAQGRTHRKISVQRDAVLREVFQQELGYDAAQSPATRKLRSLLG